MVGAKEVISNTLRRPIRTLFTNLRRRLHRVQVLHRGRKHENNIDFSVLEDCAREVLNQDAPRTFAVLKPLKQPEDIEPAVHKVTKLREGVESVLLKKLTYF